MILTFDTANTDEIYSKNISNPWVHKEQFPRCSWDWHTDGWTSRASYTNIYNVHYCRRNSDFYIDVIFHTRTFHSCDTFLHIAPRWRHTLENQEYSTNLCHFFCRNIPLKLAWILERMTERKYTLENDTVKLLNRGHHWFSEEVSAIERFEI